MVSESAALDQRGGFFVAVELPRKKGGLQIWPKER
jgi:hypothetical protein